MNTVTFWTPSYRNDADRFTLLRKSIREFYSDSAKHIVVVPQEDVSLFKRIIMHDENVELLVQNDFVNPVFYPSRLYGYIEKLFPNQTWRFKNISGCSGWIIHIIVKLSMPKMISDGVVVLIDSDVFFTKRFSNKDLDIISNDNILIKDYPKAESGKHRRHMEQSRKTLAIEAGSTDYHYMSTPDIWYPEYVKKLQDHLETLYKRPWQEALFEIGNISSSTLYGVFVDEVLKPASLRIRPPLPYYIAWDQKSYDEFMMHPEKCCADKLSAVIQSNINCSVNDYIDVVEKNFFGKGSKYQ